MLIKGKVTEQKLRSLIEADRSTGIPAAKDGKINRSHYARQLGCTPGALSKFILVFSEYEDELSITTGPMRHFSEMRTWLAEAYASRQLRFDGHILERDAFAKRFKLRGGTFMVRHEDIRNLFQEFDARAKSEGYVSAEKQKDLDHLRAALASQPAINKDRLTINQTALAERLAFRNANFREPAFRDLIEEKEAEILNSAKESTINPYFHSRIYAFDTLSPTWPTKFLERVGEKFFVVYSGKSAEHAKKAYLQLCDAFSFIGTTENKHCQQILREAIENGRVNDGDAWEEALHLYRASILSHVKAGEVGANSADGIIGILRSTFEQFAPGVVPETSVPLPGVRLARVRSGHLRSIAETKAIAGTVANDDYAQFARARFREINNTFGILLETGESASFLENLSSESAHGTHRAADIPTAVRKLLERRLDLLKKKAIAILDDAADRYERGQELLSLSRIDPAEFEREYFGREPADRGRRSVLRAHFPEFDNTSDEGATLGVANLLRLIEQQHSGIPPEGGTNTVGPRGQFFAKRYLDYGGLKTIVPMMIPAPEVAGAVLTLYLIESGANVSVGRTLEENCLETSDLEGYTRITGNKARAKGKPIIVDLAEHSPAVRAIKWFRSASARVRACADDDSDRLFLMRMGGRAQLMTPHWYTYWFKRFTASIPALSALELTPVMLRPSVLLHASLSNDGRLATGLALGQNGLAVSQGYQVKFPTKLLYDENIRRFQAAFETLVMSGVEEAAKKLGITEEEFSARLSNMRPTGLGTFCRDQRGRPGQTSAGKCTTLDCWNDCPYLLIVAEVDSIAALQIWQSSLRSAQPEWERDRPERWDEVWLPWLCLTDVVSEKMARGPQLKIWNEAKKLAAEISSRPNFVPPKPW
jgi:hypothetical protein